LGIPAYRLRGSKYGDIDLYTSLDPGDSVFGFFGIVRDLGVRSCQMLVVGWQLKVGLVD
jgi:hypothetical protein